MLQHSAVASHTVVCINSPLFSTNQTVQIISSFTEKFRALDHPILGPKFSPIPNAKKYIFSQFNKKNASLTKKKNIYIYLFCSPSLFIIIQIHRIESVVTYLQFHRIIEYNHNCFFLSLFL